MTGINVEELSHDASPSWHGFNYQGKVALYLVTKIILDKVEVEHIKDYELEIEYLEDISILYKEEYFSIHQVKTLKSNKLSSYKNACLKLIDKIKNIGSIKSAYLHVSTELDFEETFIEDLFIDLEETQEILSDIENKLKLFDYDSKKFCSFDEIEEKIINNIKSYYTVKGIKYSDERCEKTFYFLLGFVDKLIKDRHRKIQEGVIHSKSNNFIEILKILDENHDTVSEEYALLYSRNKFSKLVEEYLLRMDRDKDRKIIPKEKKEVFESAVNNIIALDNFEFLKFCRKIKPNFDFINTNDTLEYVNQFVVDSEINACFFKTLKSIERSITISNFTYEIEEMKLCYLPSAIIDDDEYSVASNINRGNNEELLFEVDKIITHSINLESIGSISMGHNRAEFSDHNRITKIKDISLIDIEKAKGELKI